MGEPRLRHVVVFRFAPGTPQSDVETLHRALMSLPHEIPEILSYRGGIDMALSDTTWDYALVADFASEEEYRAYARHPAHLAVIERCVAPIAEQIVRVQHRL